MLNVYRGTVTTDQEGAATVELPGYVAALNREFSYHLTVVGDFARAVVSAPLRNGRFEPAHGPAGRDRLLAGPGRPGGSVGRGQPDRGGGGQAGRERNLFLHPELYDQPSARGLLHSQYPAPRERVGPPA